MEPASEPILRKLAPALRELERRLRGWLGEERLQALSVLDHADLEGAAEDLGRQGEALHQERPLLTILFMGGTGVGKSTLLNALAGGNIAQASLQRPTTRDPVVYYHETVPPARLAPALRECRLVSHGRPGLEQKVLVDTPDLDSNDLSNRDKLLRLLPVADVVLYVGSQEKYHDELGWNLFRAQRRRRAFAFVLNKWDRCRAAGPIGRRPDEDLLIDLRKEGFASPLLFRTCAQHHVDLARGETGVLPEGEQFEALTNWLETGLSRLEIEAIKARGVGQLLVYLEGSLRKVLPPDLTATGKKVRQAWQDILREDAAATTGLLLETLDPYQKEVEHHFALQRQGLFKGMMGTYLHWFHRLKYAGSALRDQVPFLSRGGRVETTPTWDLAAFTQACSRAAGDKHLQARQKSLANRLQVAADRSGFPLTLLGTSTERAAGLDWNSRHGQAMIDVLGKVEHSWTNPRGWRRWLQGSLVFLADWLPVLSVGATGTLVIWQYTMEGRSPSWSDLFLPLFVLAMVLVVLHVLLSIFLPLRWHAIRGTFAGELEKRLLEDLENAYGPLPGEIANRLLEERRKLEQLLGEIRQVTGWLEGREQAAGIAGLYGD